jgi:hypothetical protein
VTRRIKAGRSGTVPRHCQSVDTPEFRTWLSHHFETHSDPRAPRYWELVATVSGGPADSTMGRTAVGFTWLLAKLGIANRAALATLATVRPGKG